MKKRLIVNFADGNFRRGQERLAASCRALGHDILCYGDADKFITPHCVVPYYFKVDALTVASAKADVLLWADASVFATGRGSLDPIFEHIEREGYYMHNNGWNNAQWCNDASLKAFGFSRDDAEKQCQVNAACYGLAPHSALGRLILNELIRHRHLFHGERENSRKTESQDLRCLGHRHDQSVLSLIAARFHLATLWPDEHRWCFWGRNPDYLLNLEGMR